MLLNGLKAAASLFSMCAWIYEQDGIIDVQNGYQVERSFRVGAGKPTFSDNWARPDSSQQHARLSHYLQQPRALIDPFLYSI